MPGKKLWASALTACFVISTSLPAFADDEARMPDVIEWQGHYLVLQGENHLPVAEALSTPFATFYRVEDGYIPTTPMGKVDEDSECYKKWYMPNHAKNEASVTGAMTARDDAAAVSSSAEIAREARQWYENVTNCPRDLGEVEAGSYVFDGDGNSLAGLDFLTLSRPFEVASVDGERFIVFPEGGDKTKKDPAIKPMELSGVFLKRHPSNTDDDDETSKLKIKPYIPGAPSLPVVMSYPSTGELADDQVERDVIEKLEADMVNVVKDVLERLEKAKKRQAAPEPGNVLLVVRAQEISDADTSARVDEILKRLQQKIDGVLNNKAKLTTVSFGNELPICNDETIACWQANRSAMIYVGGQR